MSYVPEMSTIGTSPWGDSGPIRRGSDYSRRSWSHLSVDSSQIPHTLLAGLGNDYHQVPTVMPCGWFSKEEKEIIVFPGWFAIDEALLEQFEPLESKIATRMWRDIFFQVSRSLAERALTSEEIEKVARTTIQKKFSIRPKGLTDIIPGIGKKRKESLDKVEQMTQFLTPMLIDIGKKYNAANPQKTSMSGIERDSSPFPATFSSESRPMLSVSENPLLATSFTPTTPSWSRDSFLSNTIAPSLTTMHSSWGEKMSSSGSIGVSTAPSYISPSSLVGMLYLPPNRSVDLGNQVQKSFVGGFDTSTLC